MTKKLSFKKIVYFDEQAATDLLLEKNSGFLNKTHEILKKGEAEAEAGAEAKTPSFIKKWFSISLSGNAKGTVSSLAQTEIKSTILTDFLGIADDEDLFNEVCSVKLTEDSLGFIRSAGKYLKMFNRDTNAQGGLHPDLVNILNTLNIEDLDKILDQASGYYRMIGSLSGKGKNFIIRFNFNGIRNNYKLTDLPQMNLRIIGVKVGTTNTLDIGIDSDLGIAEENDLSIQNDRPQYLNFDVLEDEKTTVDANLKYDIIDAIIAGVE